MATTTRKPTTTRKAVPRKSDSPPASANLEALAGEISTDSEPFTFTFKGKRFITQNPFDLDFQESMQVDRDDLPANMRILLGDEYDKFIELKPTMKHVVALHQAAEKFYAETFGNPGESQGSQTS